MADISFPPARMGRRMFLSTALSAGLAGCSTMRFPVQPNRQQSLDEMDVRVFPVTTENIKQLAVPARRPGALGSTPPPASRYAYRVGVGDQIRIDFFADPARVTGAAEGTPSTTAVIDETGSFFYPFIGKVQANGRTVSEIREDLVARLEEFFATPQVDVTVTGFNARSATITGSVGAAGNVTLTNVPLTLLDLVNQANPTAEADLSRIGIRRNGHGYTVNLRNFLETGSARNNPVIQPGDLVRVPESKDDKIFTFGEMAVRELPLGNTDKTLVEVLAESGGINRIRADARGIFVFRRDDPARKGFDVYQFDLSNAASLILAAEFQMAPLDIVFVTNDPATRWSDIVTKLIQPFNSLVSAQNTVESLSD